MQEPASLLTLDNIRRSLGLLPIEPEFHKFPKIFKKTLENDEKGKEE